MGLWSKIVESWSNDGYRRDYYEGEEGSGKHIHDYYEVGSKSESGRVETNEATGEHTPIDNSDK